MKVFGALVLLAAINAAALAYYLLQGPSAPLALAIALLSVFISFRAAAAARERTLRVLIFAAGATAALLPALAFAARSAAFSSLRLIAGL